jgi:ribosomal protein S18 acetylase RimI-like enzyme
LSEWKGAGGLLFLHQQSSILGMLQMKRSRTFWELSSFFVDPTEQGKGYGKQLLRYALESADAPVCLRVKQENPAQLLYRSMGFSKEELSDQRYYMKYLK